MFPGRDYEAIFQEACKCLPGEQDPVVVERVLRIVEDALWRAVRSAIFSVSLIISCLISFYYFIEIVQIKTTLHALQAMTIMLPICLAVYWLCRAVFHHEIGRFVRGRDFGKLT